ncbi:MAG: hypothetical protein AAGK21_10820 [Bacteroidota bacterium]
MRLLSLALVLAACAALPAQAQDVIRPSLRSTFVVPSLPGEPVRVTIYARRPPDQGRLSRRYRGLRVQRAPQRSVRVLRARPAAQLYRSPHHAFVRRGGSFFPVVPSR